MIRHATAPGTLTPGESWALNLLVDLARVVPVEDPGAPVVELEAVRDDVSFTSVADARRARWGMHVADGRVLMSAHALAFAARIAAASDEQYADASDRYGRVPSAINALVAQALEREPVVHEAAVALRDAVRQAARRRPVRFVAPWPDGHRWAAAFTHDLDVVAGWPAFAALRWAELLRRGHLRLAARAVGAAARSALSSPVRRGIDAVLAIESRAGVRATWFVLCGTPTLRTIARGDLTYRSDSAPARAIIEQVRAAGHEIALHGSFATFHDAERFAAERGRLAALVGLDVVGVRQHFLRARPPLTQHAMRAAGFRYDATLGFPDRNGFRLGVADVISTLFDDVAAQPVDLAIVPLVWMDRALSKYRGVEAPDVWIEDALAVADACRRVEGLWTGLWHPNLTDALGYPGALRAYARLVDALRARGPYVAPVGELVAWRAARRSVRVRRLTPDGRPHFAERPADVRVCVEDDRGAVDAKFTDMLHR